MSDRPPLAMRDSNLDMVCVNLFHTIVLLLMRFAVVRAPEEAADSQEGPFDYVLLCVKALPDVYDLAAVIESVVTPQHTCILVNTTHSLGVEDHLESRFPSNVVLSLVSGAEIAQLGAAEFEHKGSTEIWVGPANKSADMPSTIQEAMAEALAMTLSSGQVDCHVSANIRQQQYERMIGSVNLCMPFPRLTLCRPIAYHPLSVIFDTSSHAALLEKTGVRNTITEVIDELINLAQAQNCSFPPDFKETVMTTMVRGPETNSIMYQDYAAKRPMEVETYLGSPIKLAQVAGVKVPRIETLYAILHNLNIVNQERKDMNPRSPVNSIAPSRMSAGPTPRAPNGSMNGPLNVPPGPGRGRGRTFSLGGPAPGRRGPPSINGGGPNGYSRSPGGYPGSRTQSRRGSMEGNELEEFSHLVMYNDIPEGGESAYGGDGAELSLRAREVMLKERELALREQEFRRRRGGPGAGFGRRNGPPTPSIRNGGFDDDDDEDDYVDPADGPPVPLIDPDNFDMMSVTSKRNRMAGPPVSNRDFRRNPESDAGPPQVRRGGFMRPSFGRGQRPGARMTGPMPGMHDNIMEDPMMSYSSNRYGTVDRQSMGMGSRTNSLTTARLDEMSNGPSNGPYPRRASQSPGNPYGNRGGGRPSPPNGYGPPPNGYGPPPVGRPSPPGGMRQPSPRQQPGQGTAMMSPPVEQYAGVSNLHPSKASMNVRSLTGSASASAGSGDSTRIDSSEPSAHSSQSSLGPRPAIGVR